MFNIKNISINHKIDMVHIYFGTAGAAGLYLNEIYLALKDKFNQECVVNYYFPFTYGKKYFYKLTEMTGTNAFKKIKYLRYFVRYLELIFGLIMSFFLIIRTKPTLVNYNLISQHFLEYLFLISIKKFTKCKLILTLHDVVPFESQYITVLSSKSIKQKIISTADYLLIHNDSSALDLKNNFIFKPGSIIMHEFPLMDAVYLMDVMRVERREISKNEFIFLFVGHGRVEKGVDLLIDAWRDVENKLINAKLIVAGNFSANNKLIDDLKCLNNAVIINEFLSDENYFELISRADCVILPYKRGTNSGIPSTAMSLGTDVICSDIPMFQCNSLLSEKNYFKAGSSESLAAKIIEKCDGINSNNHDFDIMLKKYRYDFKREVSDLYGSLVVADAYK